MPLTLKTLTNKVNDLETEFAGEKVTLKYRSGIITPAWEKKYKGKEDGVYHQASEIIEEWDVTGEDGKPYPTDVESLRALSVEFIAFIVGACANDLVPNRRTSGKSGASSFGG